MNQAAAIKRATQQARNAMQERDTQAVDQLLALYREAADQVRAEIRAAAGPSGAVEQYKLRPLLDQINGTIDRLGQERDALLEQQVSDAATLGVRPFTASGVIAVGGSESVLDASAAQSIHHSAVDFVMNTTQVDGLNLSERLWKLDQGAKEVLQRAIASGVIRGSSSARAASDLAFSGQLVPPEIAAAAKGGQADQLVRAGDLLTSPDGGEIWKAERVLRTEMNRAHGEGFMASAIKTPGFTGFRMLLSPAHPRADICDLLTAMNLYGLGRGVYPTRELTPWPAHPNTLTFLEIVFKDEISAADRAGKETELQALQRMTAAVREGVLGQTKAQYFDRGLLTKGMVRARLSDVQARLGRQGKL
jgi:hypothetical protein